jgi:predicted GNAT family acetyltransferase
MLEGVTPKEAKQAIGHPLDQVVLNALTSKQHHLAEGNNRAFRFPVAIGPFAAMIDQTPASYVSLSELIGQSGPLALVTPEPLALPAGLMVIRHAVLLQMVWQGEIDSSHAWQHVELTEGDVPEMLALAAAAQPGPFGPRTIELGHYLGVRQDGKLAAMAGERMRLDGYSEISAVCVDAGYRGQGHAVGLMKLLIAAICARQETPFLHVMADNQGAIRLYQNQGFRERRSMHLTVLDANTNS